MRGFNPLYRSNAWGVSLYHLWPLTHRFSPIEIPMGRLGTPDEVAETVLWMVKTGYVTNKVIGVDGGLFVQ